MSILIKGMEMPTRCLGCGLLGGGIVCRGTGKLFEEFDIFSGKPDYCPLIEVPEHGRLIDADVLEDKCHRMSQDEWNKSTGTTWGYAYATFESEVEDAPTVIPADKDGET